MKPTEFLFKLAEMGAKFFDQKICTGKKECIENGSKVVYISFDDNKEN